MNCLRERSHKNSHTPELAATPARPVQAVKEAVTHLMEVIYNLETNDYVSLEIHGESVHHEENLAPAAAPPYYFAASERLDDMQAGHYDGWTNLGGGIAQAIHELTQGGKRSLELIE